MHMESLGGYGIARPGTAPSKEFLRPKVTFTDLQARETVAASEVIEALWHHADVAAYVNAFTVIGEIERSGASEDELLQIHEALVSGIIAQARVDGFANTTRLRDVQGEYAHVLGHVGLKLEGLAR
jgi:hypothetical protein